MDEPAPQQEQPEEEQTTVTPAEVWGQLDEVTRSRVIELFAHLAYDFVAAQHEDAIEEDCDVSSRRDAEGDGGAH